MDGLLRSEFALLLRDSVNNTPRRRIAPPTSPVSRNASASPLKKPRAVASLGLRLNIESTDSMEGIPIPTSPTSPLPSHYTDYHHICQSPKSTPSTFYPTPHHISSPTFSSSSSSSSSSPNNLKRNPHSLPPIHFSPAHPLDVLASVSAEQLDRIVIVQRPLMDTTTHSKRVSSSSSSAAAAAVPTATAAAGRIRRVDSTKGSTKKSMAVVLGKGGTGTGHSSSGNAIRRRTSVTSSGARRKCDGGSGGGSGSCSGGGAVVKSFKCSLCPSTFSQQFNLNKHVRAVHERRRPFQCNVCHARFQQKSHRTMHHLAVHEKLRQFSCDECGASFSWRGVLKKHRKSIHGMDE